MRQPRYEVSDWFDILSNQHYGKSLKQYLSSSFVLQLDGHIKHYHIQFALLWSEGVNKMEWVLVLDKGAYISCKVPLNIFLYFWMNMHILAFLECEHGLNHPAQFLKAHFVYTEDIQHHHCQHKETTVTAPHIIVHGVPFVPLKQILIRVDKILYAVAFVGYQILIHISTSLLHQVLFNVGIV